MVATTAAHHQLDSHPRVYLMIVRGGLTFPQVQGVYLTECGVHAVIELVYPVT
jgi:hypothetical protein